MKKKSSKKKETPMDMGYAPSDEQPDKQEGPPQHEIESAADTIMRAEEHKSNEKLMEHVYKHLAKKKKHIDQVTSIKGLRQKISSDLAD